ncbi:MAG: sugar ABC transporter permease [Lentisphaeria bacterium]|nr:ABC transporter permease subunit [Lentisphaeria bacterium]NQZ69319.1 sugar ABC transporter permease [Lentisphaeria bacterium]
MPDKPKLNIYWEKRGLLMMFAPCLIFLIIFCYLPMSGLLLAFKEYDLELGVLGSKWVGLKHFRELFVGDEFINVLKNTLKISLLKMGFGFFAPIIFAILLNEIRLRFYKSSVQTLSILPHFFSWVMLGGIFRLFFAEAGSINSMISTLGFDSIQWLTDDFWFIVMLIATEAWKGMGWGAIVYLASISSISPDLYEAASIDGCSRFQKIRHITIPALIPTMITLLILSLGGILSAGFDQIYNLYSPAVYDVSDVIDTYVLRLLEAAKFEIGIAAGIFQSVIGMILILLVNAICKKLSSGEQGVF